MKKKNLLVLLILPFLISTLTIVSVNMTYDLVDIDISYIEWDYEDVMAYQITDELIPLKAVGVNQRHNQVSEGNNLVWKVVNQDGTEDPYAVIVKQQDSYFLQTVKEGDVVVTCSNQKGNVSRSFNCIVFKNGYISIRPAIANSRVGKVDNTIYYGEFDFNQSGQKVDASFDIVVECRPASVLPTLSQESITVSDTMHVNIDWTNATEVNGAMQLQGSIDIDVTNWTKQSSKANLTIKSTIDSYKPGILDIHIVKDGYNVYNYQQLLDCTNRSKDGEIVVLQSSFDSAHNYADYLATTKHAPKYQNVKCMGDLDGDGKADFQLGNDTVVPIRTKYNHLYIDQWNQLNPDQKVSLDILTGLYVQKDFYGNGHSINFHDLTSPAIEGKVWDDGTVTMPELGDNDLFRGPKPFYTVGDPTGNGLNLITVYGQDNSGMYARGNIVINDVVLQNCDNDGKPLAFLETVGTVLEVDTDMDNNLEADSDSQMVVKNCRFSNGKNIVRSFSSNLLLDNCMLTNARNFLFFTGSNKYAQVDGNQTKSIISTDGTISTTLNEYLSKNGPGDAILDDYLAGKFGKEYTLDDSTAMQKCLYGTSGQMNPNSIQAALTANVAGQYKGNAEIRDCILNTSGIASIALETLFNGPFMFNNNSPRTISTLFDAFGEIVGKFKCYNISGTSYPVKVTISGTTKFYDYKTLDSIDLTGLVHEDISKFFSILGAYTGNNSYNITIDEIFPIKTMLNLNAKSSSYKGANTQYQGKVNIPVIFYGGGANYSQLIIDENADIFDENLLSMREGTALTAEVNLLDRYLNLPKVTPIGVAQTIAKVDIDKNTLIKTVTIVTGYEPFEFLFVNGTNYYDNYLINQEINLLEQLMNNAK
ncbi:MAG: hypothetical protein IJ492_01650 [Clostridia bacterium]|nr:hypothetical protein [Clostridia bacterium]